MSSTHGKYNGIILTRGNLPLSNGTSAFTAAEFQTLTNYEATFQVRRASLYTSPDAGYGYSGSVSQDTSTHAARDPVHGQRAIGVQLRQLHQRRVDQRRLRLPRDRPRTHRRFRC